MILAILFGLLVLGSLLTSGLLFFEVLPASPSVLSIVGGGHGLFAWFFFRGYVDYRSLHALVQEGRGELFELGIASRIRTGRFRGFRDHYRLRRVEGLVLAGMPEQSLRAAESFRSEIQRPGREALLSATVAEAAANLDLGQTWWADRALHDVASMPGAASHRGLQTVLARHLFLEGDAAQAAEALSGLASYGPFPFRRVLRSRHQLWLGEALEASGRPSEAAEAYSAAERWAPRSHWGILAIRRRRTVAHRTAAPEPALRG